MRADYCKCVKNQCIGYKNNRTTCTSDAECPIGKKCFECHGFVSSDYVPKKYCYTDEEITRMQAACAVM